MVNSTGPLICKRLMIITKSFPGYTNWQFIYPNTEFIGFILVAIKPRVPSLRDLEGRRFDPALKRWAIIGCSFGTEKRKWPSELPEKMAALIETPLHELLLRGARLAAQFILEQQTPDHYQCFTDDFAGHLGFAEKTIGEDDGDFDHFQALPPDFVRHFYLKAVAVGADFIEINGFKSAAAEAFISTGRVAQR